MTTFDWQAQLKPSLPADWLATQGKGVKIAVLDSGLHPNHPAFKHFNQSLGHRYNATLPGNRLLFGGNDDVSEQKTDESDHGTSCLSIISGLQDGVFQGIAPAAEVFIIKISRKVPNTPFELFQAPDFINGLNIAKALKVDLVVAALTYSQMKLGDFDISKAAANQALDTLLDTGTLLFSSLKNYHVLVSGLILSAKYFPTWHPRSINCGYIPAQDVWQRLSPDPALHCMWDNFQPAVYRADGVVEAVPVSTSFATYAAAGVAALALAHHKANGQDRLSRAELLQLLQQAGKPLDSAGSHSHLQLLMGNDQNV